MLPAPSGRPVIAARYRASRVPYPCREGLPIEPLSFVRSGRTNPRRPPPQGNPELPLFFDAPIRHPPPGQISTVPSGRVRSKIRDRPFIVPSEPSSCCRTACEHRAVLPGRLYLARETGRQAPRIDRLHQPRRHLPILVVLRVNLRGKAQTVGDRPKNFSKGCETDLAAGPGGRPLVPFRRATDRPRSG